MTAERQQQEAATEPLPSFPEQISAQLGGWRGSVEAAIPIAVFIVVNMIGSLRPALIASVALALLIAAIRLGQRRPIRYALNGLFGIALGAIMSWRTGEARDFYLPGIFISYGYAAAMIISVVVRHPLVGWLYSVLFTGGKSEWRTDRRLMRTFTWLTLLWALVWILKVSAQAGLYLADQEHLLGVARLVLGTPPYLLLLVITLWVVRRVQRNAESTAPSVTG
ncbi:MAG TPA: DUF3159 domain-containing protein [Natronosporangium sp.]